MKFNLEQIGEYNEGIDGHSTYYIATVEGREQFTLEDLKDTMKDRFCYDSRGAGSKFCDSVLVTWQQYRIGYEAFVTVIERYDV